MDEEYSWFSADIITHISLAYNQISKFPSGSSFENLKDLTTLDLTDNQIDFNPSHDPVFSDLACLSNLNLNHNKVTYRQDFSLFLSMGGELILLKFRTCPNIFLFFVCLSPKFFNSFLDKF